MMKTKMADYIHAGPNFAETIMAHNGLNPIHQARVAKDYQLAKPKNKNSQPKASGEPGSPWLSMMGGK